MPWVCNKNLQQEYFWEEAAFQSFARGTQHCYTTKCFGFWGFFTTVLWRRSCGIFRMDRTQDNPSAAQLSSCYFNTGIYSWCCQEWQLLWQPPVYFPDNDWLTIVALGYLRVASSCSGFLIESLKMRLLHLVAIVWIQSLPHVKILSAFIYRNEPGPSKMPNFWNLIGNITNGMTQIRDPSL